MSNLRQTLQCCSKQVNLEGCGTFLGTIHSCYAIGSTKNILDITHYFDLDLFNYATISLAMGKYLALTYQHFGEDVDVCCANKSCRDETKIRLQLRPAVPGLLRPKDEHQVLEAYQHLRQMYLSPHIQRQF